MEETSNLALPYILPSQAQKHVTHNEALRRLDAIVQLGVVSRGNTIAPETPVEGERHIVAPSASGAWEGEDDNIAAWQDGAWAFYPPQAGWVAVVLDEDVLCYWSGTQWNEIQAGGTGTTPAPSGISFQNIPLAGFGTEADANNPFAAKLNNALWTAKTAGEGGSGDLRYKMNKESAANTLSLLMQTAYSGRAEIGLTGSDDLALKVSPDGDNWLEALAIDSATGEIRMPYTNILRDYCLNLYTDSGRFAGANVNAITIGSFALPSYLTRYNNTTVAGYAKYLYNNTDYGGNGGTLNSSVKVLLDKIRDPAYRRYGVEFWVAEFTHGSGTGGTFSHLSQTWYLSLMTNQTLRAPNMTFHAYFRAIDANIMIRCNSGQTILVDGVVWQDHAIIPPSDGWVSVTIFDSVPLRESLGYLPMTLNIFVTNAGHRYQMACPALMGGITSVDDNVGVVAAAGSWPS